MVEREVGKAVRCSESVAKAARSARRRAGWLSMVPSREMRRPAWSWFRSSENWKRGMRASARAAISGGVVDVMVLGSGW